MMGSWLLGLRDRFAAPPALTSADLQRLRCPDCTGALAVAGGVASDLVCQQCSASWPGERGFIRLYREATFTGTDRFMRRFYNGAPIFHDPAVRFGIPLFETEGSEEALRSAYIRRLELDRLPRTGAPLRVLEVGVGTGVNLARLKAELPTCPQRYGHSIQAFE